MCFYYFLHFMSNLIYLVWNKYISLPRLQVTQNTYREQRRYDIRLFSTYAWKSGMLPTPPTLLTYRNTYIQIQIRTCCCVCNVLHNMYHPCVASQNNTRIWLYTLICRVALHLRVQHTISRNVTTRRISIVCHYRYILVILIWFSITKMFAWFVPPFRET